jgi:hypothetical protein
MVTKAGLTWNSCEFESRSWRGGLDTTLCDKVCQWLATGQWFSPVSSTNKTGRHNTIEILLKVVLTTIALALLTGPSEIILSGCNDKKVRSKGSNLAGKWVWFVLYNRRLKKWYFCFSAKHAALTTKFKVQILVGETGVPGENHRPVASHWQTLSHIAVSSKPRDERGSNSQLSNLY